MHHLDPVGRYVPSSLDVSRAAAERHPVLSALRERDLARTPPVARLPPPATRLGAPPRREALVTGVVVTVAPRPPPPG